MSFFVRMVGSVSLGLLLLLSSGCTSRGITVTSNPPGAELSINRRVVGTTPMRVQIEHYGSYRFELRKKGYDVLVKEETIKPTIYGYDPAAFVADNIVPLRLNDEAYFHYNMIKIDAVDTRSALLERANSARNGEAVNPKTGEKIVTDLGQNAKKLPSDMNVEELAKIKAATPAPTPPLIDNDPGRTIHGDKPKPLTIAGEYGLTPAESTGDFQKPDAKKSDTPKEVRVPKEEELLYEQPEAKDDKKSDKKDDKKTEAAPVK